MGAITDRSLEHLAPSDRMIAVTRRKLLNTAQALAKGEPVPDNEGSVYAPARGGYFLAPESMKLTEAYEHATREAAKKRRT